MEYSEKSATRWKPAAVECYAGHRGDETPRAVTLEGARFEVTAVFSRERIMDNATRAVRERWRCRLEDGRLVIVERLGDGSWQAAVAP